MLDLPRFEANPDLFSCSSVAWCRLFYLPEPQFSHLLKGSIKIVHAEFSLAPSKCLIKGSYCHIETSSRVVQELRNGIGFYPVTYVDFSRAFPARCSLIPAGVMLPTELLQPILAPSRFHRDTPLLTFCLLHVLFLWIRMLFP